MEFCKCYNNGKKPAILTDWRKTNICQSCLKSKIFKNNDSNLDNVVMDTLSEDIKKTILTNFDNATISSNIKKKPINLNNIKYWINLIKKPVIFYDVNKNIPEIDKNGNKIIFIIESFGRKILILNRQNAGKIIRILRKANVKPIKSTIENISKY